MAKYAKCPRCELNYVDTEKQQFCDVCLKEMKGVEDDTFLLDDDEEGFTELCPKCGENMMRAGEEMCDECRRKMEEEEKDLDEDIDGGEEWRSYIDEEDVEEDDLGLDKEMAEELEKELDEEDLDEEFEEEEEVDDDDFEYVSADDYNAEEDEEDDGDSEDDF